MSLSVAENRYMLPYTGHGMIEHHPRNMTVAGVVGHELRHKVSNELKAAAQGEVVRQQIKYNIAVVDGKIRVVGGVTEATFYKKVEDEKPQQTDEMPASADDPSKNPVISSPEGTSIENPSMGHVDEDNKIEDLEGEIALLEAKLERLQQSAPYGADPATEQEKALIQQEIQKIESKIEMEKAAKALQRAQESILGAIEKDSGFAAQMMASSVHSQHGTTSLYQHFSNSHQKGLVLDTIL